MRNLVLFILCCLGAPLLAQDDFRFEDDVYLDYIKSVKFHHSGLFTSLPLIDLNSNGRLILTFDDLTGVDKDYTYEIIHCDRNWKRSDLDEYDFINGFNNEEIQEVSYSIGTTVDYTNYTLTLPNDDIEWTISGNYLLVVYEDEYDKIPAITRRFMVAEQLVVVETQVEQSLNAQRFRTHHAIDITVNNDNFRITNVMSELQLTILQNHRWDTAITGIKPRFFRGDNILFNHVGENEFAAGKEFRIVDLRSSLSRGEGVHALERLRSRIDVLVQLDRNRSWSGYHFYNDINGQFVLENNDRANATMQSEYMNVFFNIQLERPLLDGEIYIVGAFCDWKLKEFNKLEYDSYRDLYSVNLPLKQGFYDYVYAVKRGDDVDYSILEGDWFETENEYTILAYYSELGSRHDRIIGVSNLNTARN